MIRTRLYSLPTLAGTALLLTATASAVPPGEPLEFPGGGAGTVIFDGGVHAAAGNTCNDCHTELFEMSRGEVRISFPDHGAGEISCFACHNGTASFQAEDNCQRCHIE